MEDNYFDKRLKSILEAPPQMKPDELAIEDLRNKLRAVQPSKRRLGLWPLWLLLQLALLLGGGYLVDKYLHLEREVSFINEQLTLSKIRDTIVEKVTVHHYDTIYKVVYQERYIKTQAPNNSSGSLVTYPAIMSYYNGTSKSGFDHTPFSSTSNRAWSLTGVESNTNPLQGNYGEEESKLIFGTPLTALDTQHISMLPLEKRREVAFVNALEESLPKPEKQKRNPLYYFAPTGIGIEGQFSPLAIAIHEYGGNNFIYGVNGTIGFAGGRSMCIGGQLMTQNFEIKDANSLSSFPVLPPDDPTDALHELKGHFSYIQIPIVLRQQFRLEKDFQPMVSLGMVLYTPFRQRFIYEYINAGGEYKLRNTLQDGSLSSNSFRLGAGGVYHLKNGFSIISEAVFQNALSMNEGEYFKHRYWALNIGLGYKFSLN